MKNKVALFSGLALFLSFCLLTGAGKLTTSLTANRQMFAMLVAQILAFVLPILLIKLTATKETNITMRTFLKISNMSVVWFSVLTALVVSLLTFLINYILLRTGAVSVQSWSQFTLQTSSSTAGGWLAVLVLILVPAICEEFFLRGALFSAHEKLASTSVCIVLSGVCFALLHGSVNNFIGPLLAGMLYAYLTYAFDCVWLAVGAHIINNAFAVVVTWFTSTYSAFGIWKYVPSLFVLLFLALLYLALRSMEVLIATNRIRTFQQGKNSNTNAVSAVLNPGFIVFLLAFLAKAVFKLF